MKHPINMFFCLTCLLVWVSACVPSFQPEDLESNSRLAVFSNFTSHQEIQVHVSVTGSVLEPNMPQYVTDAEVTISQDGQLVSRLELMIPHDGEAPPYYTTRELEPVEGEIYTIRVEAEGFEPVTAQSRVPTQIGIDQVTIRDAKLEPDRPEGFDTYHYKLDVRFKDPDHEPNFYHLSVYQEVLSFQIMGTDTAWLPSKTLNIAFDPAANNNNRIASYNGGLLLEDTPFKGKEAHIELPVELRIKKNEEAFGKIFVELRSVTEEYFLFYSSVSKQKAQPKDPYTEPILIFNNVQNGLGIFAGYNASRDSIRIGF